MSAPFFLGKVIDVIYTNPSGDFTDNLSNLCALLSGIFFCGAAANAVRVYLMQTSGNEKSKLFCFFGWKKSFRQMATDLKLCPLA